MRRRFLGVVLVVCGPSAWLEIVDCVPLLDCMGASPVEHCPLMGASWWGRLLLRYCCMVLVHIWVAGGFNQDSLISALLVQLGLYVFIVQLQLVQLLGYFQLALKQSLGLCL